MAAGIGLASRAGFDIGPRPIVAKVGIVAASVGLTVGSISIGGGACTRLLMRAIAVRKRIRITVAGRLIIRVVILRRVVAIRALALRQSVIA